MNTQDGLLLLMTICEKLDIRVSLEYDPGRYIPGEFITPENIGEDQPDHIVQGPKGWTIEVANYGITDKETGRDKLFSLGDAIARGLAMVKELSIER